MIYPNRKMKKIIFVACWIFISHCSNSQSNKQVLLLKVSAIVDYAEGYVIKGIDSLNTDTLYFVSLKDSLSSIYGFQKIKIGNRYLFEIEDVDNINGHLPAALPNGYYIRIGTKRIKRESRNGKTLATTQFFAKNTRGLYIQKKE
jgi:hypothetical protein